MAIRVSPTAAPKGSGTEEVTITVTDEGGGGDTFKAKVFASYDATHLRVDETSFSPSNASKESSQRSGGSQIEWTTTSISQNGEPCFSFSCSCLISGNPGFACWVELEDGTTTEPVAIRLSCP